MFEFSVAEFSALFQVIMVDLVLAADNAIVVGMAAAGLPAEHRRRVIFIGIVGAAVMRIGFALITVQLMQVIGLMLAGGLLLLWVAWKLWREIQATRAKAKLEDDDQSATEKPATKTVPQAIFQIIIADLSMSLDNVLAVAGIARDHTTILIIGLVLSVAFMGLAATFIANLLNRYHWIAYVGLLIIVYVALAMIWDGGIDVFNVMQETSA